MALAICARSPNSWRQKLEIRRFAAAGAGAGEFEQRFEELDAAYIGEIDPGAVIDRECFEERDIGALGLQQRQLSRPD